MPAAPTAPTIKIDKKVPIPTNLRRRGPELPFDQMKVGDSFWVPIEALADRVATRARVAQAASQRKRRNPALDFTVRWDGAGVRVWRVA